MRNLVILIVIILVVGISFFLLLSRDSDNKAIEDINLSENPSLSTGENEMNKKQFSSAPTTLPESDRVGKKARFETNQGNFTISLYGTKTPKTVSNFIFLTKEGFYNGLTFHRVIDGFMIQGGDPDGNGTGGPGYKFEDEFDSSLTFSKVGVLAMANSGPNTNGSQFFITVAPTPHLNSKHTIFGKVVEGYEVVEKISKLSAGGSGSPTNPVVIKKIQII